MSGNHPANVSFGIAKRRRVEPKDKTVVDAFGDDSEDEDETPAERPGRFVFGQFLSLEDAETRSARLQQEGIVLAEAGRFRPAVGKWNEAIECTPNKFVLHEMKAQALLQLGEDFHAICAAERTVDLAPAWPPGWIALGRAQLGLGEIDKALSTLGAALELRDISSEDTEEVKRDLDVIKQLIHERAKLADVEDSSSNVYKRAIGVDILGDAAAKRSRAMVPYSDT